MTFDTLIRLLVMAAFGGGPALGSPSCCDATLLLAAAGSMKPKCVRRRSLPCQDREIPA